MGLVVAMAKEMRSVKLDAEMRRAVEAIEAALSESGYTGFFDLTGGDAHVDSFYFNGELHVQEGNKWFVRKEVR